MGLQGRILGAIKGDLGVFTIAHVCFMCASKQALAGRDAVAIHNLPNYAGVALGSGYFSAQESECVSLNHRPPTCRIYPNPIVPLKYIEIYPKPYYIHFRGTVDPKPHQDHKAMASSWATQFLSS